MELMEINISIIWTSAKKSYYFKHIAKSQKGV